jgi:hypothetical protein
MVFRKVITNFLLLFVIGVIGISTANAAPNRIKGTLNCTVVDDKGTASHPIPFVPLTIKNHGSTTTDANGKFTLNLNYGILDTKLHLTLKYSGNVTTAAAPPNIPKSISTPLKVMEDRFIANSDDIDASGTVSGSELDLGTINVNTRDCELWRIGAAVLDDYHKVDLQSPPAKKLHIMRPVGVVVGTAYVFYDYVRVRTDYLKDDDIAYSREDTIFHEFAHTVRHVFDSPDNINHWNCDDFRWAYARTHCGNEIYNMHFAFNEGWAGFWASARHRKSAPYDLVRNCNFAPPLDGNEDWVESYVANALLSLEKQLMTKKGMTKEQANRKMLDVLRKNPRTIHSLYAFKKHLHAAVGWPVPPEPAKCPKDYTLDGLTCRKDVVVQAKPSYTRGVGTVPKSCGEGKDYDTGLCYPDCRSGYRGVGPVCWGICLAGYHDDGATCRKDVDIVKKSSYGRGVGTVPKSCDTGKDYDAGLCYAECRSGYHGVGPVCWESCKSGYHDDGATCRRDARIISANNSSCPWYDKCGLTTNKGCSKCPEGYHNDGCTCRIDAHIYGKKSYGRGAGVPPKKCKGGEDYDAGLCYKACNSGYHGVGPVCWGKCPDGYKDDGATCRKDAHIVAKPSYGRGAGVPPKSCSPAKDYDAGLCYNKCKTDFHGVGPVCWGQCPKGFEDHGATCYIGTNIIIRGGSCNFEAWTWY